MPKPKLKFSLIAVLLTFLLLASLPAISVFSQPSPIIRGVNGNTAIVSSPGRSTHEPRTIAESVQYQLLKQTATIHPDGRGDYILEARLENLNIQDWTSTTWFFDWIGDYSNTRAWDDLGPLNISVSRNGTRIDIAVIFRRAIQPGETYHFYLGLTIGGMAWPLDSGWQMAWWTIINTPVQENVRGVTFPSNAAFQSITPPPTSQNQTYLEWRYFNTPVGWEHTIDVRYGLPEINFSITHIEVTQAIQDENNNVPLIASKPTFVRVYVGCSEGCTSVPNIMGTLRGYNASGEELPNSPLSSINRSITAYKEDWHDQRRQLDRTLNFTLPTEWSTGTVTLVAETGGATQARTITFQPAQSLNVIYVPIRYKRQAPDLSRIRTGASWASRIYPTAKINYVHGATLDWDRCLENSLTCRIGIPFRNRDANTKALLNELTTRYRLVNSYVFGWLPADTYGGGISDPTWAGGTGQAAFGDDHPTEGGRIFAHELAHLMGRRHTNSPDPCMPAGARDSASDWPYSDARIQEYGLDGYGFGWLVSSSGVVKRPDSNYDYMSYCGTLSEGNVWTSPWTYEHVYTEALHGQTTASAEELLSTTQSYFIASGLVYTDDTAILDPVWVITTTTLSENPPTGTEYCLEAQNASGTMLVSHCFDLSFMDYETGEATNVDGFNLMLPYPDGAARIVLKKGTTELAIQPISNNAPSVSVLSPNGGETWAANDTYTISWNAYDPDGDQLTFRVFYTPDMVNWTPIGTVLTQTQLIVNTAELAGSTSASIRVLASDGANTSSDESDAPFTIGNKPPQVSIIKPKTGQITLAGTPLRLRGDAYDLEDGTLEGAALSWSSSLDGDLGTGSELLTALFFYGQHTLTLTATDSDGNTATATVQVLVTFPEDVVPDCSINMVDVQTEASGWRQPVGELYDGDGDGLITVKDIMDIVTHWDERCP